MTATKPLPKAKTARARAGVDVLESKLPPAIVECVQTNMSLPTFAISVVERRRALRLIDTYRRLAA